VTYSIVARDRKTGEFGVAVQSHYFQVSPAVPWAQAGVGAVATQSHVNLSYGPLGLELLQAGYTAEQALKALTAGDPRAEGTNIVNLKAGLRTSIGTHNSFYVGFGQALTHEIWYKHVVRLEYRYTF